MLPCRHEFLVVAGLAFPFNCSSPQAAAVDRAGSASAAIRDLAHSPQQPKSGEPVTVTARVASSNGLPALTLRVQVVEPGDYVRKTDAAYERSWRDFPMQAEGKSGDAGGADRTFSTPRSYRRTGVGRGRSIRGGPGSGCRRSRTWDGTRAEKVNQRRPRIPSDRSCVIGRRWA